MKQTATVEMIIWEHDERPDAIQRIEFHETILADLTVDDMYCVSEIRVEGKHYASGSGSYYAVNDFGFMRKMGYRVKQQALYNSTTFPPMGLAWLGRRNRR